MPILATKKHGKIIRTRVVLGYDHIVQPCKMCPDIKFDFVPPDGFENPVLYVVGEAPGEEEAVCHMPFVGESGKLLRQVLIEFNIHSNTRIFNTVACRPTNEHGGNRTPTPQEAKVCCIHAKADILHHKPYALLLLGRVAMHAFFNVEKSTTLKSVAGKWGKWKGIPTTITWHPSFLLRGGGEKSVYYETWKSHILEASNRAVYEYQGGDNES